MLETAHLQDDLHGCPCLRLRVKRGMNIIGEVAEKRHTQHSVDDASLVKETLHRSDTKVAEVLYHGTDPDAFLSILGSKGLQAGTSTPVGVYLCADARASEMSMYNRGLIVVCKARGFPFNYTTNSHKLLKDVIPDGCVGYLRDMMGVKQVCAHPQCLQVDEFVFKLSSLVKMVDAELDAQGYSYKYHEQVTKLLAKVQDRWRMIQERATMAPRVVALG